MLSLSQGKLSLHNASKQQRWAKYCNDILLQLLCPNVALKMRVVENVSSYCIVPHTGKYNKHLKRKYLGVNINMNILMKPRTVNNYLHVTLSIYLHVTLTIQTENRHTE